MNLNESQDLSPLSSSLGCAQYALSRYKPALKSFKSLVKVAPQDKDARAKLKECEKQLAAQRFAMAISNENTESAEIQCQKLMEQSAQMEPSTATSGPASLAPPAKGPDSSYKGLHYPGKDNLTQEWCIEFCKSMKEQKVIHKRYGYQIVLDVLEILKGHGTLVKVPLEEGKEITVCGDVHGQYYDLLNIWETNGYPGEDNPYLFNGDFVDRGSFSIEVIMALFVFKILNPGKMHLSRGNHETSSMNKLYGFEGECTQKFDKLL